jgi:hypothetical protein
MASVRKVRQVGALFGGREPGRRERDPGAWGLGDREVFWFKEREGAWEGRCFPRGSTEGGPERP